MAGSKQPITAGRHVNPISFSTARLRINGGSHPSALDHFTTRLVLDLPTSRLFAMAKKTVLITGASRGIGLTFVQQYVNAGWTVIAAARTPETSSKVRRK